MTTRIRRAVAAAALTAASLTGTAALATPAFAADTVRVSFGNLILTGGPEANSIRIHPVNGKVRVKDFLAPVVAGTGCTQVDPSPVACAGVQNINANGRDGDDVLNNDTSLTSVLGGGNGNDVLDGGPNRDQLSGGLGNDKALGGPGVDICNAETETGCEEN